MKFVIVTIFLIGVSFVGADLIGTLDGVLVVFPALLDATTGFNEVADAKKAFAKALNQTNNCGSSGLNEALLNVAKGNEDVGKAVSALGRAVMNQTNEAGQLRLLLGDLSQVTDQIGNSADALKTLASYIRTLTDNIDSESLDGVDKLVASQNDLTNGSNTFYSAFSKVKIPSNLVLKLGSLLTGFIASLHNLSDGLEAEIYSIGAAEKRCHVSTGVPKALDGFKKSVDTVHDHLLLL